jgi:ankyrin repeat protein
LTAPIDLIKAIRTGRLSEVLAAFDAGAEVELRDGQGDPGLPLAIACFLGHVDIVRELAARGAKVNFADNRDPTSPLSMAFRGGRKEVIRALIELGTEVPPGMQTGLNEQEMMVARLKAQQQAAHTAKDTDSFDDLPEFIEIEMVRCFGTDTGVLDAEMIRAAREMSKKEPPGK